MSRCCCLFVLLTLSPRAAFAEEGTYIEQEIMIEAVAGQPAMRGLQKIWFTPTQLRNEVTYGEHSTTAIIDLNQKNIILLMSKDLHYSEMKLEQYQHLVATRLQAVGFSDPEAKPSLTRSKETRKIGEWNCVKYVFSQGGKVPVRIELWVSTETTLDFPVFLGLMKKMGLEKMLGKLTRFVTDIEGYPIEVRTEVTQHQQLVSSLYRVLKIRRQPIDAKLFSIPEGYRPLRDEIPSRTSTD